VTWTATDAAGNKATATQKVTITQKADTTPPTITAPSDITTESTGELTPVNLGTPVVSDDTDPSPAVAHDGPDDGFPVGTTTVTWTATDAAGNKATATQKVTITQQAPTNSPPVATDDSATTDQNLPVNIDVLANDNDPDDDPITLTEITTSPAQGGTATINTNNQTITYAPKAGFVGTDNFAYSISDGKDGSASATVSVKVNSVNSAPTAQNQDVTTPKNTAIDITLKATDPENDPLTFTIKTQPTSGELTGNAPNLAYTPNKDFVGDDAFTFLANDGKLNSNVATVTVKMQSVNSLPNGVDDTAETAKNTPVTISVLSNDVDPDGDKLSVDSITTMPGSGSAEINTDGTITYSPDTDFVGTDSFIYEVTDGNGGNAKATVSITVIYNGPPETNIDSAIDGSGKTLQTGDSTTSSSISIKFSSPDNDVSKFQCHLDGSTSQDCTSPQAYSKLSAGDHKFTVEAVDSSNNVDQTPATFSWTIKAADTTAPSIAITTPSDGSSISGSSSGVSVDVKGTASDSGSGVATVEVKIDSGSYKAVTPASTGDWSTWSGTVKFTTSGSHVITARATDNAGNQKWSTVTVNAS
jgi:hypothetical protein